MKHFTGLQSLLSTLGQVYKEIFLLMVLISVCVLTLSRSFVSLTLINIFHKLFIFSLMYFSEKGGISNWSFGDSFWWSLLCITTVGQGTNNPDTTSGKVEMSTRIAFVTNNKVFFADYWIFYSVTWCIHVGFTSSFTTKPVK